MKETIIFDKPQYLDLQRRVVANKTLEGWIDAPHAAFTMDLDVTPVLAFIQRCRNAAEFQGVRFTINSFALKMIAEGVKESPHMNAHINYSPAKSVGTVTLFKKINIATPMSSPHGGMVAPVLMDVGNMSLREVCEGMERSRQKVLNTDLQLLFREAGLRDTWQRVRRLQFGVLRRLYPNLVGPSRIPRPSREAWAAYRAIPEQERITPENLTSGTLLVSNLGSAVPGLRITPLLLDIIPPQVAAIGLGSVVKFPEVRPSETGREEIVSRDVLPMTICFDHRAMDLDHLLGFIKRVHKICEEPETLLP